MTLQDILASVSSLFVDLGTFAISTIHVSTNNKKYSSLKKVHIRCESGPVYPKMNIAAHVTTSCKRFQQQAIKLQLT